ncbi:MAG TPA: 2-oxoglutarate and iron-dependent oxygenase domain-containing protein [Acidimicrobiales bacterium]|nr:2-oxoglutarate and iron-dependent oxygenase domain-containing protein [Acidimicrobiales bacterium]
MGDAIVDVDLAAFEHGGRAARRAVVEGVMRSLRTGFVYTSHDIPAEVLDAAYEMLETFFHLPHDVKQRYAAPESYGQTGYTGLLVETAAGSSAPDWKEMLNWGENLPLAHPLRTKYPHRFVEQVLPEPDVPGITEVLMAFHRRLLDLQRRFLRIIAVGIGCDEAFFEDLLRDGTTLNRAIRYPPMEEAPGTDHVWAGAHGDINLITALPRATARGLQVETVDGWVDAVPPEGSAIINTGIMLERLTNGLIPVGVHRVVSSGPGERYSVVQFCHPSPWTVLSPVPSCVDDEHPLRFGAIEAGDLLDRVLWEINLIT